MREHTQVFRIVDVSSLTRWFHKVCCPIMRKRKKDPKYEVVVADLIRRIMSGEFKVKPRLPGHLLLAKEYGVSSITSNRALNELRDRGFVTRRPRGGTYALERPRLFSGLYLLAGAKTEDEERWLANYWSGVAERAEALSLPVHVMKWMDPRVSTDLLGGERLAGAMLCGFEEPELIDRLEAADVPHVVVGVEAARARFNVLEDRRKATLALTNSLRAAGCQRVACVYDPIKPNHHMAKRGYLDSGQEPPIMLEVNDGDARTKMTALLEGADPPDGLIVVGGGLPFQALPVLMKAAPNPPALGVLMENPVIERLRHVAHVAAYSQAEVGRLAFDLLYEHAAGRVVNATTVHAPFKILVPQ